MKILFIGPIYSTFTKIDIKILSEKFSLLLENSSLGKSFKGILNLISVNIRSLIKLFQSNIIYCWFADYSTFIPVLLGKLLGKKIFVIAGGFDVCYKPELNYGAKAKAVRWFCVKNTFKLADKILPVSYYAKEQLLSLIKIKENRVDVLYNAIECENFFKYLKENKKYRELILTVSGTYSSIEYKIKGIDKFIETARLLPRYQFVVAGLKGSALSDAKTQAGDIENLTIIPGPLSIEKNLLDLYCRSSIYLQLSIDESFGMAVVEAMACGSIPIVSQFGALPEIVPNNDFIASTQEELLLLIEKYFNSDEKLREEMQEHSKKFDISHRKRKLLSYF